MGAYTRLLRPLLFRLDAERAHHWSLNSLALLGRSRRLSALARRFHAVDDSALAIRVAGIDFPNPLGLAAGFDKNGLAVESLAALGFGSIEIGSVSAEPAVGNPKPRLARLVEDQAVLVNYGVPNDGIDQVVQRLLAADVDVPVGLNLVETNRGGPAQRTDALIGELTYAATRAVGACDYLMLNLNCPNSDGGHSPLTDPSVLRELIAALAAEKDLPPIFLKPTACCDVPAIDSLLRAIDRFSNVGGFAFNVAPVKPNSLRSPESSWKSRPGVICGPPLRDQMRRTLEVWAKRIDRERYALIASGGITDPDDAYERIRLGASLIQIYTGLIYQGPQLVRRLLLGIRKRLREDGFESLSEAVGSGLRSS